MATQVAVLGPGETLFIPCNWYHATVNLADTVAVGGQAGASERGQGRCSSDIYGAASAAFAESATRGERWEIEKAYQRGEWACEVNQFNFNCAPHLASLLLRKQQGGGGSSSSDNKAAAVGVYTEAVGRYERLAAARLLNRTQLSAVLSHYSERLMQDPGFQGHRPAMELAGALVTKAVEADPLSGPSRGV